jgi:hypothetical protein
MVIINAYQVPYRRFALALHPKDMSNQPSVAFRKNTNNTKILIKTFLLNPMYCFFKLFFQHFTYLKHRPLQVRLPHNPQVMEMTGKSVEVSRVELLS